MQILISPAKTMAARPDAAVPFASLPVFAANASLIAADMAAYSAAELARMLKVNPAIAAETFSRYRAFGFQPTLSPAVFAYDGIVFKKIDPQSMSASDLEFAQTRLNIASPLYGMLRPLDLINPYRLESGLRLPFSGSDISLLQYWKPILTDWFIEKVKSDDGLLVNLASNEYLGILDWKRVSRSVTVVSPRFMVMKKGRLASLTVYAKINRGALTRHLILSRADAAGLSAALASYSYESFSLVDDNASSPLFVADGIF